MRIAALLMLLVGTTSLIAEQRVLIRPAQVTLPSPSVANLNYGFVVVGLKDNQSAFRVEVQTDQGDTPSWRLFVRAADETFDPPGFSKPTSHLEWKFNDEPDSRYRVMTTADTLVYHESEGETETLQLDLRCRVGWKDRPAIYSADLIFTLILED